MEKYLGLCLGLYMLGAMLMLGIYLTLFLSDRTTPLSDRGSWFVLLLATLLWPVVLPLSFKLELLPRLRRASSELERDRIQPQLDR